jgi:hypothetical protein
MANLEQWQMKKVVERQCNKNYYRMLHVPLWIWVFFILPGQMTADLFSHGPDRRHWIWLGIVAIICSWRGYVGALPGCEQRPDITHYGEDKPNLLNRVVCYTAAWIDLLVPFTINLIALTIASLTGKWMIYSLYAKLYYVFVASIVLATALNLMPRTKRSTRGEGTEKAWFYVAVWVVVPTQIGVWTMWRLGRHFGLTGLSLDYARLATFLAVSTLFLALGILGRLPRTARYRVPEGLIESAPIEAQGSARALEPLKY